MKIKKIFLLIISCLLLNVLLVGSVYAGKGKNHDADIDKIGKKWQEDRQKKIKYLRNNLPKILKDLRRLVVLREEDLTINDIEGLIWGFEEELSPIEFAKDDVRVVNFYWDMLKKGQNVRGLLNTIKGLNNYCKNNKEDGKKFIALMKDLTKSRFIRVRLKALDILYEKGYKKETIPIYAEVLSMDKYMDKLIDEFYPTQIRKKSLDEIGYEFSRETTVTINALKKIMLYKGENKNDLIKKISRKGEVILLLKKYIKKRKKIIYKPQENFDKSVGKLIKVLENFAKK